MLRSKFWKGQLVLCLLFVATLLYCFVLSCCRVSPKTVVPFIEVDGTLYIDSYSRIALLCLLFVRSPPQRRADNILRRTRVSLTKCGTLFDAFYVLYTGRFSEVTEVCC